MRLKTTIALLTLSLLLTFAALSVHAQDATATVEPAPGASMTFIPVATNSAQATAPGEATAEATSAVITMIPVATNGSEATFPAENTAEATTEAVITIIPVATTTAISSPTAEETPTAEATSPILVSPTPARATSESAPAGVSTLVLLVGIGAVLLVGGMILARENSQQGGE